MPVHVTGFVRADAVTDDMEVAWMNAEMTYQFTCGACHELHAPDDFSPQEWISQMQSMVWNANMRSADALMVLKWLQTKSEEARETK
ncbi:hypothetical protein [Breoghania sp.]|uniref:hypothetical protein n=1 Tax=Breoghania sp. TaxID=2065378 RepID=UPI00261BFF0D|nr:hypothetical protein [Breoghania sp.]MDJ0932307.1 hypothetical protein [Breoghania sp.]